MRLSAALLPLLSLLSLVSADDLSIPGENPLHHCALPPPKGDLLTIHRVDLAPNPPLPGEKLLIHAKGHLKKTVTNGKISVSVKYGLIKLLEQEIDLCENADKVDEECPIEEGELDLTKEVELPKAIPPGKYTVRANVYTEEGEQITCLTASVVFRPDVGKKVVEGIKDYLK